MPYKWEVPEESLENPSLTRVVSSIKYGNPDESTFRILANLKYPVNINRAFIAPNNDNYKFVVDFRQADMLTNLLNSSTVVIPQSKEYYAMLEHNAVIEQQKNFADKREIAISKWLDSYLKNVNYPTPILQRDKDQNPKVIVVIDPGHGGKDPGAMPSPDSNIKEKDIVLSISNNIVGNLLKNPDIGVVLTRRSDYFVPLKDRILWAKKFNADLFISIHADRAPSSDSSGLSVYTLSQNASDAQTQVIATNQNKSDIIAGLNDDEDTEVSRASYGVTTAALNYFNKSLNALTLAEAALLAILPRSPNGYNPTTNYNGAKARRDWAINRMLEDGKITQEEAEAAINEPIVLAKRTNLSIEYSSYAAEEVRKKVFNIIPGEVVYSQGLIINTTINNELQKYAYFALRNGIENVDNLKGYRGPLTNLLDKVEDSNSENLNWEILLNNYINNNVNIQKGIGNWQFAVVLKIEKDYLIAGLENGTIVNLNIKHNTWAVPDQEVYQLNKPIKKLTNFNSILKEYDVILLENYIENNSEIWLLKQIPKVNGSIVVMNPINGYILAMQGGYSYNLSQFNRATQALRQPGSAFKAFVYLAALEKGMTPASLVLDAPYTSENNFQIWKPKNNTSRYAGYVTMRNALEVSRNLASIRIAHFAGLDTISDVSKRLGIYNNSLTNFSEVIGSKETTLLKMVKAYAVLANGGKNVEPVLVNKISNREGDIIFKNDTRVCENCNNVEWHNQKVPSLPESKDILVDPRNAYLITNMLEGVVNNGIAWRAKVPGYDIGGKTGTTNESKDLWFFGFTPQVVVGIFIGEDIPTSLEPAMASTMVVPIFQDFASQAFPLLFDKIPFKIPDGIEMKWIDPKTGQPVLENSPKKFLESFRADNLPKKEETHTINGPMGEGVYTDDGIY
ncbi:UNVERIFIED_CONTAM: hypothetical protein PYX00_011104 [Menopon gallinae]|uniref:serine-type D-Ala-D-Ala carboxypeptidase n=1 Tax=Menopon gallinae TaxID=328185 RepID=A0AAW2H674_9NEOP